MFVYRLSSYMVQSPDVPEYLIHNVSKRHSPTVTPFVAAPGPWVFSDIMRSEMEAALDRMGWGTCNPLSGLIFCKTRLNVCPFPENKLQ